ncbi:hypothetical protein EJ110_NYTH04841 [Nymphaea thermarum]|nr:hypothetical protein EJ110_NYTH04841 [Nymphaea thermarum]
MKMETKGIMVGLFFLLVFVGYGLAWTGEINGRVMCDVCSDSAVGPEDHALEGAEVAVLCITKSGEVLNYQAFTDAKGIFTVAETMSETNSWESCLARPISSFHEHCNRVGMSKAGRRFKYNLPSGYSHTVRPFLYQPAIAPLYCS